MDKDETGFDPREGTEVMKLIDALLLKGVELRASAIHLEPGPDAEGRERLGVRYRVDGLLREAASSIPWSSRFKVMARIKIMANMDITLTKLPQAGVLKASAGGTAHEFWVETAPTRNGEACVLSLRTPPAPPLSLADLGLRPQVAGRLDGFLARAGRREGAGLFLVAGPRKSGVTTALYAFLEAVRRPELKLVTVEAPIERPLQGVTQLPVYPTQGGSNYAVLLRSAMRQDCDVAMLCDFKDSETANLLLTTALEGRTVLSSVHTADAPAALERLLDMDVPAHLTAAALSGVLAVRLRRRLCGECREAREPSPAQKSLFAAAGVELPAGTPLYGAPGCGACQKTGFKGFLGIHEFLLVTDPLRRLVVSGAPADALRAQASADGTLPLLKDALEKAKAGLTTAEEAAGL
ncbi:MAG: Flp pilus assembly complex ATPase component TadA [Elusimicrobia bacterium]|nr:Flp pilus assembly complex ATPase component TadA [Elusimicrobiota bacterium]